jgi:GDP-4-dehydro-6-deoxy-D-mannose reductase
VRLLITGITGFVGPYLAEHIAQREETAELWGLAWGDTEQPQLQALRPRLRLVDGDLTEPASLHAAIEESRPELVFHLAAATSVAKSWEYAERAMEINALGTIRLYEALRRLDSAPLVVVASSSEIYGRPRSTTRPLSEDFPIRPVSPYGTTKAAQDLLAAQLGEACGIPTVRLRPFNLTGPRRPEHFVASSFARQVARIENEKLDPVIRVGNLEAVRDFTDVRDAARAYWMAANSAQPGEAYNLCSGRGVRVGELLEILLEEAGADIEVRVGQERIRPNDVGWQVGDPSKLSQATGWAPEIPIRKTLVDLLDWWRAQS